MARILVIDDDPEIRSMLRQMLERVGHEVMEAGDGKAGVELYREQSADLIIMDIIMPVRSGWAAIVELRREFPDIKIIAISGGRELGPHSYLTVAKRFGAKRIFRKPIEKEELLEAVGDLLAGKDRSSAGKRRIKQRTGEKRSILLIDGDPDHSWALCENLRMAGHTVIDTPRADSALKIMEKRRFNVAILDVFATRVGKTDLIKLLRDGWTDPLIIGMADFETLALQRWVIDRGADHFVGKPVDIDDLLDLISPPPLFSGDVQGVDILEYIQFFLLSGKKTVLRIESRGGVRCKLYLNHGDVVHADGDEMKGEAAFHQCMKFDGGRFTNLPWAEPEQETISKPGELLLIEAARRRDEA